jgi:hypothetical protein
MAGIMDSGTASHYRAHAAIVRRECFFVMNIRSPNEPRLYLMRLTHQMRDLDDVRIKAENGYCFSQRMMVRTKGMSKYSRGGR